MEEVGARAVMEVVVVAEEEVAAAARAHLVEGVVSELGEQVALLQLQRNLPRALPAQHREALRERRR